MSFKVHKIFALFFLISLNCIKGIQPLKLKPIMMDGNTPKIDDFGLARSTRLKPVTQSMDVRGTAHYMSPEHFFDFRKAMLI
jgi:serine/threonine protein kinase